MLLIYLVKRNHFTAHLPAATSVAAILAGDYRTLCGQTVAPARWGLSRTLPRRVHLCRRCAAAAARGGGKGARDQ